MNLGIGERGGKAKTMKKYGGENESVGRREGKMREVRGKNGWGEPEQNEKREGEGET
jgi:hypothetical protein